VNSGRIVFWQQNPSPHQASWIKALAELSPPGKIVAVFQDDLPSERVLFGWKSDGFDYGQAKVSIHPNSEFVDSIIFEGHERATHVFSGMVHVPAIMDVMRRCFKTGATIGLLSEGRDTRGLRGFLRGAHSFLRERRYRDRVDFVLAIGHHADRWYRKCGYLSEQLFPFCYTVEKTNQAKNRRTDSNYVVLTFVGRLIPCKRLDLLLRALAAVRSISWALRVIGDGSERRALEKLAGELNLLHRITFTGVLENSAVRKELVNADLFVLPSRWDGWGAVVNEALMSGTPVICSSYCGAADLISNGLNGEIFEYGSADSLVATLERWISKGPLGSSSRTDIMQWSKCLEGATIARYFLQIMQFLDKANDERPKPPWAM
jgi:glycosyltransferase involved in cell wall biosynthesis